MLVRYAKRLIRDTPEAAGHALTMMAVSGTSPSCAAS